MKRRIWALLLAVGILSCSVACNRDKDMGSSAVNSSDSVESSDVVEIGTYDVARAEEICSNYGNVSVEIPAGFKELAGIASLGTSAYVKDEYPIDSSIETNDTGKYLANSDAVYLFYTFMDRYYASSTDSIDLNSACINGRNLIGNDFFDGYDSSYDTTFIEDNEVVGRPGKLMYGIGDSYLRRSDYKTLGMEYVSQLVLVKVGGSEEGFVPLVISAVFEDSSPERVSEMKSLIQSICDNSNFTISK